MELWLVVVGAVFFWLAAGVLTILAVKRRTGMAICLCVLTWLLFLALAVLILFTLMFVAAID
ncbi:MAG: hypothetical protein PHD32_02410 [Eubacteriales bacterium]|nr:hypothetical protein [Eubacteriales bacterium]